MEGQPRCKKCGRILKSPVSIARGMGPKCAGVSAASGMSIHARVKRSSGMAYQNVSLNHLQSPLFSSDLPTKLLKEERIVSPTAGRTQAVL